MAAQTLPRFRELPQELRDAIWEFTTSLQPRIIEVRLEESFVE
jgi:hypothetical protein